MSIISFSIVNFEFAPKFEKIKPESITLNKDVYPYTLKEFMDKFKRNTFGRPTEIWVIWGTTRHKPSDCKHAGYISDAMYIPELIQKFQKLNKNVIFKSALDIDVDEEDLKSINFILCGDGEVNYIAAKLLDSIGDAIKIKYEKPDKPFFMEKTSRVKHHMYGVVHILKNPWARDRERFILQLGGIGAIGTISALKWFSDKLDRLTLLPNSPFAVIKGEEKKYPYEFNGYENHCEYCCRVVEEEGVYWRGKISNVLATIQQYPQ